MDAQLVGGGAIAQGQGAAAVGAGGVGVQGNNEGTINLGVLIQQGAKPGASQEDLNSGLSCPHPDPGGSTAAVRRGQRQRSGSALIGLHGPAYPAQRGGRRDRRRRAWPWKVARTPRPKALRPRRSEHREKARRMR